MRITAKGQVTIPQHLRRRAGLMPGTDVEFEFDAGAVRLVKVEGRNTRAIGTLSLLTKIGLAGTSGDPVHHLRAS